MAEVMVTREILERLDRKLRAFSWQLADDERDLLRCLLALGSRQAAQNASEVSAAGEVGLFGGTVRDVYAPLSDLLHDDTTIFVPPPPPPPSPRKPK
jgi:hypothetical protein